MRSLLGWIGEANLLVIFSDLDTEEDRCVLVKYYYYLPKKMKKEILSNAYLGIF